jgi:hypothetical protein
LPVTRLPQQTKDGEGQSLEAGIDETNEAEGAVRNDFCIFSGACLHIV